MIRGRLLWDYIRCYYQEHTHLGTLLLIFANEERERESQRISESEEQLRYFPCSKFLTIKRTTESMESPFYIPGVAALWKTFKSLITAEMEK